MDLSCPLCFAAFRATGHAKPISFQCGHTVCFECSVATSFMELERCSVCGAPVQIRTPNEGLAEFAESCYTPDVDDSLDEVAGFGGRKLRKLAPPDAMEPLLPSARELVKQCGEKSSTFNSALEAVLHDKARCLDRLSASIDAFASRVDSVKQALDDKRDALIRKARDAFESQPAKAFDAVANELSVTSLQIGAAAAMLAAASEETFGRAQASASLLLASARLPSCVPAFVSLSTVGFDALLGCIGDVSGVVPQLDLSCLRISGSGLFGYSAGPLASESDNAFVIDCSAVCALGSVLTPADVRVVFSTLTSPSLPAAVDVNATSPMPGVLRFQYNVGPSPSPTGYELRVWVCGFELTGSPWRVFPGCSPHPTRLKRTITLATAEGNSGLAVCPEGKYMAVSNWRTCTVTMFELGAGQALRTFGTLGKGKGVSSVNMWCHAYDAVIAACCARRPVQRARKTVLSQLESVACV